MGFCFPRWGHKRGIASGEDTLRIGVLGRGGKGRSPFSARCGTGRTTRETCRTALVLGVNLRKANEPSVLFVWPIAQHAQMSQPRQCIAPALQKQLRVSIRNSLDVYMSRWEDHKT